MIEDQQTCWLSRTKVVLIIIDALKFDFVYFDEKLQDQELLPYQNKLKVINDLLTKEPNRTRLFKFIADPPTTTMQRLKGLTTGSLPTFVDVGSNFATTEINEDNILDQIKAQNKNIVFMGDDTWSGLYPKRFIREYSYPSFNVWDLDTVDSGIMNHLLSEIVKKDWSLLVAHFLGVDHCGHRYGPYHPEMARKLNEMNDMIRYGHICLTHTC
jgi:phosphatidylinositol glycan class O